MKSSERFDVNISIEQSFDFIVLKRDESLSVERVFEQNHDIFKTDFLIFQCQFVNFISVALNKYNLRQKFKIFVVNYLKLINF